MRSGIYKITNAVTGAAYYGSSLDIDSRWKSHVFMLEKGNHGNPYLQKDWIIYGSHKFNFDVIENMRGCEASNIIEREQYFLDNAVRWEEDYNVNRTATTPVNPDYKKAEAQLAGSPQKYIPNIAFRYSRKTLKKKSRELYRKGYGVEEIAKALGTKISKVRKVVLSL